MIQNLISMFRMAVVQFQNLRDFYSTSGGFQATILIRHKYCQGKTTQGPSQASRMAQLIEKIWHNMLCQNELYFLSLRSVSHSRIAKMTEKIHYKMTNLPCREQAS